MRTKRVLTFSILNLKKLAIASRKVMSMSIQEWSSYPSLTQQESCLPSMAQLATKWFDLMLEAVAACTVSCAGMQSSYRYHNRVRKMHVEML
jgi:hypothetical protein